MRETLIDMAGNEPAKIPIGTPNYRISYQLLKKNTFCILRLKELKSVFAVPTSECRAIFDGCAHMKPLG